jgi:NADH dehydrogenase FAD-containing subunit
VFAIGDISSVDEPKLYANAKNHHSFVSQNVVSLIQGKEVGSLKEYKPGAAMMVVSVGSKGGAGQLFGWVLGVSLSLYFFLVSTELIFSRDVL